MCVIFFNFDLWKKREKNAIWMQSNRFKTMPCLNYWKLLVCIKFKRKTSMRWDAKGSDKPHKKLFYMRLNVLNENIYTKRVYFTECEAQKNDFHAAITFAYKNYLSITIIWRLTIKNVFLYFGDVNIMPTHLLTCLLHFKAFEKLANGKISRIWQNSAQKTSTTQQAGWQNGKRRTLVTTITLPL